MLVKAVVLAQVDPFVPQFTPQFVVPMVELIQTDVKLEIRQSDAKDDAHVSFLGSSKILVNLLLSGALDDFENVFLNKKMIQGETKVMV